MAHIFGTHAVDNGGIDMAVRRSAAAGLRTVQIFTAIPKFYGDKSSISPKRVERFHAALEETGIDPAHVVVHAAYVAPTDGGAVGAAELREHLAAELPAWMIPAYFMVLPELPMTPTEKVDRRALPPIDIAAVPAAPGGRTAPATPTEEAVAAIWREVLSVDEVGAEDDFFDLGGHSLKATRILSRIAARLGVELPVGVIFDHPTVREMAALVDERLGRAGEPDEAMLQWLEGLSDEEAERLLAET